MFLTKLRLASGVFALVALTVGLSTAALPSDAPGAQPDKGATKSAPATKAPERKMTPPAAPGLSVVEFADKGTVLPDRTAVQGFWTLERITFTAGLQDEKGHFAGIEGHTHLFVAGDVWWMIGANKKWKDIRPDLAWLDPGKNPKWLDLTTVGLDGVSSPDRHIYCFNGPDALNVVSGEGGARPAEFDPRDADAKAFALHWRRQPAPAAAGARELLGSWEQPFREFRAPNGTNSSPNDSNTAPFRGRVEVYDGLIFVGNLPNIGPDSQWIGGRYTVDTARNPPGIDIALFNPMWNGVSKLYGSYEATPAGMKLVIGLSGKRAARPMDFAPPEGNGPPDRLYFDMARALRLGEKPEPAPMPKPKDAKKP